jgi:hypothetical protein
MPTVLVYVTCSDPATNLSAILGACSHSGNAVVSEGGVSLIIRPESWNDFPKLIAGFPVSRHWGDKTDEKFVRFYATEGCPVDVLLGQLRSMPFVWSSNIDRNDPTAVFCLVPESWEPVLRIGGHVIGGVVSESTAPRRTFAEGRSGRGRGGAGSSRGGGHGGAGAGSSRGGGHGGAGAGSSRGGGHGGAGAGAGAGSSRGGGHGGAGAGAGSSRGGGHGGAGAGSSRGGGHGGSHGRGRGGGRGGSRYRTQD